MGESTNWRVAYMEVAAAKNDCERLIAAKDREIADLRERCDVYRDERNHAIAESVQLRQQRNEASILHLRAMAQRDEARECVKRLCEALRKIMCERELRAPDTAAAALAATPEHLRNA